MTQNEVASPGLAERTLALRRCFPEHGGRRLSRLRPMDCGPRIERHVPMLPLSREVGRFARLRRSVTLYRMVFGQPRQEDLLEFLMGQMTEGEAMTQAEELRLDLGPRGVGVGSAEDLERNHG